LLIWNLKLVFIGFVGKATGERKHWIWVFSELYNCCMVSTRTFLYPITAVITSPPRKQSIIPVQKSHQQLSDFPSLVSRCKRRVSKSTQPPVNHYYSLPFITVPASLLHSLVPLNRRSLFSRPFPPVLLSGQLLKFNQAKSALSRPNP
jgi:hypothetical protein